MKWPLFGVNIPQDVGAIFQTMNSFFQSQVQPIMPGVINASVTPGSNGADATDDTLQSFTLPAGFLASAGNAIRIKAWGLTANNTNVKTLKLKFGATPFTPITQALTISTVNPWELNAIIGRITATTQVAYGSVNHGAAVLGTFQSVAGAETLANALAILLTGSSGSSGAADITCNGWIVESVQ